MPLHGFSQSKNALGHPFWGPGRQDSLERSFQVKKKARFFGWGAHARQPKKCAKRTIQDRLGKLRHQSAAVATAFYFTLGRPLKARWLCAPSRMRVVPRPGQE